MPGLGSFSRGRKLLGLLKILPPDNERQDTSQPDESPLPVDAESKSPHNPNITLFIVYVVLLFIHLCA